MKEVFTYYMDRYMDPHTAHGMHLGEPEEIKGKEFESLEPLPQAPKWLGLRSEKTKRNYCIEKVAALCDRALRAFAHQYNSSSDPDWSTLEIYGATNSFKEYISTPTYVESYIAQAKTFESDLNKYYASSISNTVKPFYKQHLLPLIKELPKLHKHLERKYSK